MRVDKYGDVVRGTTVLAISQIVQRQWMLEAVGQGRHNRAAMCQVTARA